MGPLIKTIMTRCIHCTRCVRFATEVAGVSRSWALRPRRGRGDHHLSRAGGDSEMSGNVIDLCPVGALTSRPYALSGAALGAEEDRIHRRDGRRRLGNIRVDTRGNEVMRVLPR
jgi:NADH-quinone oxidoreductase subunit G